MTTVNRHGNIERAIYKKKPISHRDWYASETLAMPQEGAQEAPDAAQETTPTPTEPKTVK